MSERCGPVQGCYEQETVYTNEPLGEIEVVADFLPAPSELAFREEGVKVTLALSKKSVEFFKSEASKRRVARKRASVD